jgi:hypothetical protein
MQTFLPYPDFKKCAMVLDYRRLGNQRNEATALLKAIDNPSGPWGHHPAARMWRGYNSALLAYRDAIILEWLSRGYKNNIPVFNNPVSAMPPWIGQESLHSSHRAVLIHKDPTYYSKWGWIEQPYDKVLWPV